MTLGHFGPIAPNKNEYDKNVFRKLREDFKVRGIEYSLPLENSCPEVFCSKGVLRNFAKFTGKRPCQGLFFNKNAGLRQLRPEACNFIKKETLAQVFSCEFCKIFKNTFSYRAPPVAASSL